MTKRVAPDSGSAMDAPEASPKLRVKRHSATATLPERKSALAAGYDLCADEALVLAPGGRKAIETNITVEIPPGNYGRVAPRSGLAVKSGINVLAGVIDADYRGKIGVVLVNHSYDNFTVRVGDRIAQLIVEKISLLEVEEIEELSATERGEGGFGSTGMKSAGSPREEGGSATAQPAPADAD